jgi:PAS domain S-box-containing protein
VGTIVSIPAAIASGYRISTMGLKTLFVIDIFIAILLIIAYLTRNKTNYRIRTSLLLVYVFIMGWIALNTWGLWGFGLFIMFFTIIIATTLFGLRYGVFLLILSLLILIGLTFSIHYGWLTFEWDFNTLSHSTFHWFSRSIFFMSFVTMTVVTLGLVHKNFEKVNKELSISEARYNLALDSVNEVIWELEVPTGKAFVSPKFFEILHFAPNEFAADFRSWKKLIHPDDIEVVNEVINKHMTNISPSINVEYRIKNKYGGWQWILTKGKIVSRSEDGYPTRVLGTHSDIGPRKEMERILKESEQRYRLLFMNANDTILLVENNVVIDTNESAFEFFGMVRDQLIGINICDLCPEKQSDGTVTANKLLSLFEEVKHGTPIRTEWELERLDGKVIDVIMSVSVLIDEERYIYQILLHDISERKQFEQAKLNAILETEERERLKLAGDLHDDVGPLLSSLNMYLSLINREQTQNKEEILENMQDILKDTIGSIREISNNISPHNLNNYGLVSAIKSYIEREQKLVEINFEENLNDNRLPRIIEIMCYRIVKEMINNTIKYAKAQTIWINLSIEDKMLYLSYRDNGIGFDVNEAIENQKTGIGLLNILNRLNTLKATYTFKGKPGEGFNFEMKLRQTS